jgi:hypothetical protein
LLLTKFSIRPFTQVKFLEFGYNFELILTFQVLTGQQ